MNLILLILTFQFSYSAANTTLLTGIANQQPYYLKQAQTNNTPSVNYIILAIGEKLYATTDNYNCQYFNTTVNYTGKSTNFTFTQFCQNNQKCILNVQFNNVFPGQFNCCCDQMGVKSVVNKMDFDKSFSIIIGICLGILMLIAILISWKIWKRKSTNQKYFSEAPIGYEK